MKDNTHINGGDIAAPEFLTVSPSPHVKHADNTRVIMLDVVIALIPALMWGTYVFGLRVLTLTVVTVLACVLFEALFQLILKRPITIGDFSAVVTGLLIALNLPASAPLWLPVAGAFFAIIVVKQLFGGIGKNFVNPALAARVFLFSWQQEMTGFTLPFTKLNPFSITSGAAADAVATATPLVSLKEGVIPEISPLSLFFGTCPGTIGEISALLLIAGGIYLLVRRVITWHIPVSYIATAAAISFFLPQNPNAASFALAEILSGGLLLGAIFMATDYATSPLTPRGRLIYGVGCGLITMLIRYFGGYPEGVSFAILIMNLLVWYIDGFTVPKRFGAPPKNSGSDDKSGKDNK